MVIDAWQISCQPFFKQPLPAEPVEWHYPRMARAQCRAILTGTTSLVPCRNIELDRSVLADFVLKALDAVHDTALEGAPRALVSDVGYGFIDRSDNHQVLKPPGTRI